jgi:membrane-bound lytic murein transglycosylase F
MDTFLTEITKNGTYDKIYRKYHDKPRHLKVADIVTFHSKLNANLPTYRKLIVDNAATFGFDWRLVAAQIYQESHFNPKANSHANAYGIMQLLKRTAKSYGLKDIFDPKQNIIAGLTHLKKLYKHYDKCTGKDRMNIALAAYNVGQGHILDARNLAIRKKLDPNKWASLEITLPLLSKRKYFKDSLYGYCRGKEPVDYVSNINSYYDIIKLMDVHREITERQEDLFAMVTNQKLGLSTKKTEMPVDNKNVWTRPDFF